MKYRFSLLAVLAIIVAFFAAPVAQAQNVVGLTSRYGTFYNNPTNFPLSITNGQTVTVTSTNKVQVWRGRGMAAFILGGGTNVNSMTNVQATWDISVDGTNWTTTHPFTMTTATTSTNFMDYTNFIPDKLDNARWVRLSTLFNNGTNTLVITNVYWSVIP